MKENLIYKFDESLDGDLWDLYLQDFNFDIKRVISNYENRYKNKIIGIGLFGKLGRWNGTFDVGKIVRPSGRDILSGFGSDCTSFDIYLGEKGELTVTGYHHDGQIVLKCYLVSENKAERLSLSIGHINPDRLKSLENNLTRIKIK